MSRLLKAAGFVLVFGVWIPLVRLEGMFRLLPVADPPILEPVNSRDPVPHFPPNRTYRYAAGWDFSIRSRKRSNNLGFNHMADYQADAKSPLMAVIGDSFVEAHEVDAGKSAAELLHSGLAGQGRVYSFGISGAPLSTYLAYAEYARDRFKPSALAVFIIRNDFDESLLKYKSEPRLHYFDEQGDLVRIDYELSPMRRLLRNSALLRYATHHLHLSHKWQAWTRRLSGAAAPDPQAEMLRRLPDARRAVDLFLEKLPARAGLPAKSILLVLDADRPHIYEEDEQRLAARFHRKIMRYLQENALLRGYDVVDLEPVFLARHRRDGSRFEFRLDSHWNELGHEVVAAQVRESQVFRNAFAPPAAPDAPVAAR